VPRQAEASPPSSSKLPSAAGLRARPRRRKPRPRPRPSPLTHLGGAEHVALDQVPGLGARQDVAAEVADDVVGAVAGESHCLHRGGCNNTEQRPRRQLPLSPPRLENGGRLLRPRPAPRASLSAAATAREGRGLRKAPARRPLGAVPPEALRGSNGGGRGRRGGGGVRQAAARCPQSRPLLLSQKLARLLVCGPP